MRENNDFFELDKRTQMQKRVEALAEIAQKYGEEAAAFVKRNYYWQGMTPAIMIKSVDILMWNKR